ncbi:hypothetical protein DIE21_24140 [Burkholderia sp. Bp9140]|uniref:cellulose biosynthesis protein BcsP n=1 Tax=Burkholderia sp. Bp9140 TaxID=2184572 RepID=UPI000F577171|nr:cellulose biosynthesis protein BcsP [Burkholderia sp. Bp9140]RQR48210.1 hypothetical protein DIE21_24140 [Burkholderia sp. Bp9140]
MSTSRDIESLFKRFGGDAGRYQEVRAEADAEAARARWPLLDGVELRESDPHGQPDSGAPDNGQSLSNIVMTDPHSALAPDADRRDHPPGPLKKLVGRPAASDSARTQGPSEPLVRLFERLRTGATGEGPKKPSLWTGRS